MGEKEAIMMASVLVSIFALAAGANQFVALFRNIFPRPEKSEKRDVTISDKSASQKDFEEHCKENNRMFEQMRQEASRRGSDLFSKIEENRRDLSAEITCVKESVAGLEAESRIGNQRMSHMDGKLDRLLERKH